MRAKDLSNEELAATIRAIKTTGLSPSKEEKEYLEEAANRLEYLEEVKIRIRGMINQMDKQLNKRKK